MAGDNRLVELSTELLAEVRAMRVDFKGYSGRVNSTIERLTLQMAENALVLEELNLLIQSLPNQLGEIVFPKQSL